VEEKMLVDTFVKDEEAARAKLKLFLKQFKTIL